MKKLYPVLLAILLFFIASSTYAQKTVDVKSVYKAKADLDFKLYKFRSAAANYLLTDTTELAVIEKIAQSYRAVKEYTAAEHWFRKQSKFANQPDQFYLDFAEVLANNSKYQESSEWYSKYAQKNPTDRRGKNLAMVYEKLKGLQRDSLNWKLSYPSFNTSKDEFSPVYFNRGLIFSSNRNKKWGVTNVFGWNQTPFTDLYTVSDTAAVSYLEPADYFSDQVKVNVKTAKKQSLPLSINDTKVLGDVTYPRSLVGVGMEKETTPVHLLRANLNTAYHDGPLTLSSDQYNMVYNRNQVKTSNDKDEFGIFKLNMFSGNYVGGQWFNVKPFPHNNLAYSTAHPALSLDGEVLYFVSDMPGGFGGKDLYYCLKEGDSWAKPINMGAAINTEGDETFPYIAPNGELYFSSNGHTGLGGLDLFRVDLVDHLPTGRIKNLGYPANSSKDDFGIIMEPSLQAGYFSSNRYGSDDIFRFDLRPITLLLQGRIETPYTASAKIGVKDVKVALTYEGQTEVTTTNDVGMYFFTLSRNTAYHIKASKAGYENEPTGTVSTVGLTQSTTLIKDLELKNSEPLMDCESLSKLFKVENVYYDLDKYFIRPDAIPVLDRLVTLMKQYPALTVVAASHTDSRASFNYNVKLSDNRSTSAIAYLVKHGVESSRLSKLYFGERKLVNGCADGVDCTEEQQQLNRRTEFYLFYNGVNITINCKL